MKRLRPTVVIILMLFSSVIAAERAVAADPGQVRPSAQIALDWNQNVVSAIRSASTTIDGPARPLLQAEGFLYMSYVYAAMYDAVTKITGRYVPYHDFEADTDGASPRAAMIAAAYNTLAAYLGDPDGSLATKYNAAIAALPNGGKAKGIAVGEAAAADIVKLRAGDGRGAPTATYGAIGPVVAGVWQVVPPSTTAQTPWLAFVQPFMLESPSQFRPGPPPAVNSALFARDFNETKAYGAKNSTIRTADETATAYFWNANVINQYNQAFEDWAAAHHLGFVDTVRVLAMGNMVAADAGIACFDAKYYYLYWRPYTAIRNADLAGNAMITADANWLPLLNTPAHPEYPSAHGCLSGALSAVFAFLARSQRINLDIQGATNGGTTLTTTRHFDTVQDLVQDVANARVWAGLHYRNSTAAGLSVGQQVAAWSLQHYFHRRDRGR